MAGLTQTPKPLLATCYAFQESRQVAKVLKTATRNNVIHLYILFLVPLLTFVTQVFKLETLVRACVLPSCLLLSLQLRGPSVELGAQS